MREIETLVGFVLVNNYKWGFVTNVEPIPEESQHKLMVAADADVN